MKKIILLSLSLSFNLSFSMENMALNDALFILKEKLEALHLLLSQRTALLKSNKPVGNFNEIMKNNWGFLTEFEKQFDSFKKQLTTFVCYIQKVPENIQIKESVQFKELVAEKDSLPSVKEINSAIDYCNQYLHRKDLSADDINLVVKFLDQLNNFLNSIINYAREIADENIDVFEQHNINFKGQLESGDQHFSNYITSYFDNIDENIINSTLAKSLNNWNER